MNEKQSSRVSNVYIPSFSQKKTEKNDVDILNATVMNKCVS